MILVTGGTGFVGAHLLYHLTLQEKEIRAIYRNKSRLKNVKRVFQYYSNEAEMYYQKINWVHADITVIEDLKSIFDNVDVVYHCAALVSFSSRDYQEMRKVNIEGTQNIVNVSIEKKIKKLCFVSSIATLENTYQTDYIDEQCFWTTNKNKSDYAITKRAAEMEVWRASQEGVNCIVVNPGVIIGPGFWKNGTGNLFEQIKNGMSYYSSGSSGFVDVRDVSKSMIVLMESDIINEAFVLVAENRSFKDLFTQISQSIKAKTPSKEIGKTGLEIAWRLAWLKSLFTRSKPSLTRNSAKAAYGQKKYTSEKIRRVLNYSFIPFNETIQFTGKLFQKDKN
ncbi:SDR family oxidoreductase [Namhaeicola litoreus]|uniref:SDR family oxidoreductase n=1 Tax=Namhaeicola litoreus TaxID=1052145 RepID=A0ABW3Y0J8_9FLAO